MRLFFGLLILLLLTFGLLTLWLLSLVLLIHDVLPLGVVVGLLDVLLLLKRAYSTEDAYESLLNLLLEV